MLIFLYTITFLSNKNKVFFYIFKAGANEVNIVYRSLSIGQRGIAIPTLHEETKARCASNDFFFLNQDKNKK